MINRQSIKFFVIFILFLSTAVLCCGFSNNDVFRFNKKNFYLNKSSLNLSGGYINTYLKKGQTSDHWDEAVIIHYNPISYDVKPECEKLHRVVENMYIKYYSNKQMPIAIAYNRMTNTALLDFVVPSMEHSAKRLNMIEYHAFKYQKNKDSYGIKIFQYSKHIKVNNFNDERLLYDYWCRIRKTVLPEVIDMEIPKIQKR